MKGISGKIGWQVMLLILLVLAVVVYGIGQTLSITVSNTQPVVTINSITDDGGGAQSAGSSYTVDATIVDANGCATVTSAPGYAKIFLYSSQVGKLDTDQPNLGGSPIHAATNVQDELGDWIAGQATLNLLSGSVIDACAGGTDTTMRYTLSVTLPYKIYPGEVVWEVIALDNSGQANAQAWAVLPKTVGSRVDLQFSQAPAASLSASAFATLNPGDNDKSFNFAVGGSNPLPIDPSGFLGIQSRSNTPNKVLINFATTFTSGGDTIAISNLNWAKMDDKCEGLTSTCKNAYNDGTFPIATDNANCASPNGCNIAGDITALNIAALSTDYSISACLARAQNSNTVADGVGRTDNRNSGNTANSVWNNIYGGFTLAVPNGTAPGAYSATGSITGSASAAPDCASNNILPTTAATVVAVSAAAPGAGTFTPTGPLSLSFVNGQQAVFKANIANNILNAADGGVFGTRYVRAKAGNPAACDGTQFPQIRLADAGAATVGAATAITAKGFLPAAPAASCNFEMTEGPSTAVLATLVVTWT